MHLHDTEDVLIDEDVSHITPVISMARIKRWAERM